jgi:RNA polymerase sigma-70 factor (ECF subfamily)
MQVVRARACGVKMNHAAERVSFVLHDVFEVPFGAIATILGWSTAATKMLASRARGRIRLGTPTAAADAAAREVIDAFYAAVGRGDLVVRGADEVAARATMGARPDALGHPALIDGARASSSRWAGGRS